MAANAVHINKPDRFDRAEGIEFDVLALTKRPAHLLELETLLLAWSLLLRRCSIDGVSDFTWGLCSADGNPKCTFDFRSHETSWTSETSMSEALEDIQSYMQQKLCPDRRLAADRTVLYFNDECVPGHQSDYVNWDSGTVQWVGIREPFCIIWTFTC